MSSVVLCGGLCASPVHRPHGLPQQVAVGGHDARRHDANVAAAGELISVPVLLVVRHRAVVAAARSNNRRVGVIQNPACHKQGTHANPKTGRRTAMLRRSQTAWHTARRWQLSAVACSCVRRPDREGGRAVRQERIQCVEAVKWSRYFVAQTLE